jgi:hypothetical protein
MIDWQAVQLMALGAALALALLWLVISRPRR